MLALALLAPLASADPGDGTNDSGLGPMDIIGGELVKSCDWPDAAAIYIQGQVECSGTLVAPNVVLTAGHCADGIQAVRVGTNNYAKGGEYVKAKAVHEYPHSQTTEDITAIVLQDDITDVAPRTIASGCAVDKFLKKGAPAIIAGYGATDAYGYQYDSKLRQAEVTITDPSCTKSGEGCNASVSPGGELGAGGGGVDACFGDSGGPLYLETAYGDFLAGVTSRAYQGVNPPCGKGGIWERPDAVLDWLVKVTGATFPAPICNFAPVATVDGPIAVKGRHEGTATVTVTDQDDEGGVSFAISTPPAHGDAAVDGDGTVHYTAAAGYSGDDSFVVTATDAGTPAMSGAVTVQVTVEKGGLFGCDSVDGSGIGVAGVAGLGVLARRRRR